jgi:hypothetical protein
MTLQVDDILIDGQSGGLKTKFLALSFSIGGILGHSSDSYNYVVSQLIIPQLASLDTGFTKIEVKYLINYSTKGTATIDVQLYDYTDSVAVAGTEKNFPNGSCIFGESNWLDITSLGGKALRVGTKRNGGGGSNKVYLEGVTLLLKFS